MSKPESKTRAKSSALFDFTVTDEDAARAERQQRELKYTAGDPDTDTHTNNWVDFFQEFRRVALVAK
jgi:hypothetical protein